jgi:P27 family predicted phage terminase small subunit
MPQTLRLLNGDTHKDRYNDAEPKAPEGKMEPPFDLSDEVRKIWVSRLALLEQMDLATPADIDSWRAYCEAVVIHEKASRALVGQPVLIKGLSGFLVKNPALQIQRDAALTVLRFAQQFGLTPSARSTVRAPKKPSGESNPFSGTG